LEDQVTGTPAPFLKWAGGKGQLLQQFEQFFPAGFGRYYEPFLGGGAVFFYLAAKGRITRAVIGDSNRDLINCYIAIRDNLEQLLDKLRELQKYAKNKDFFYNVARRRFNGIKLSNGLDGNVEKASLLFYLNKTCYNGLYRVNRKNEFNVPWGRYKNPRIYDEGNLYSAHEVLRREGITIRCADYAEAARDASAKDFIYFDPPYQPVSQTSNFTAYTSASFGSHDQARLASVFRELHSRGSFLMLSNSPRAERLYRDPRFQITRLKATRAISCVGSKRGPVDELLIRNY
jgi:DNA adenine methylase